MNLELLPENHPQLKEVSTAWDFELDGDPTELVTELSKVMIASQAVGLAAPQCGVQKRIFVMGNEDKLVACINPRIVLWASELDKDYEGCLSFPGLFMQVKRPEKVVVTYKTVTGKEVERELTGLEARVFQHETDHLDGITFDTHVSRLTLNMAKKKREKSTFSTLKT